MKAITITPQTIGPTGARSKGYPNHDATPPTTEAGTAMKKVNKTAETIGNSYFMPGKRLAPRMLATIAQMMKSTAEAAAIKRSGVGQGPQK